MTARLLILTLPLVAFSQGARDVNLLEGRGELITFQGEIAKVVIAEPKIADAVVVSPREVMVNAKGSGKTTLIVWEAARQPQQFNINVTRDLEPVQKFRTELTTELGRELPGVDVKFTGNEETLVLTGSVKTREELERAAALAATRSKKVLNMLQLPPDADPKQILLQVKFASVDRAGLQEFGLNYFSRNAKTLGSLSTQQFQQPRFSQLQFQDQQFANATVNFADLLNLFVFRPDLNIGATVRALQQRNLLQILAEPNLIAIEGKEASFVAGGEFPFPILQTTTTGGAISPIITVQFKPFGVQLGFTPMLTSSGAIKLKVRPEVSSLDFANAVNLQGVLIPALSTRRAETEVVLKDGESFAIAGLIDNRVVQTINKVWGLGDIPFVGNLFRSRATRKTTDELLVVITPRFVKPLPPGEKADLPEIAEPFLPSITEQRQQDQAQKDKWKMGLGKKGDKNDAKSKKTKPEYAGPRGQQEPKP